MTLFRLYNIFFTIYFDNRNPNVNKSEGDAVDENFVFLYSKRYDLSDASPFYKLKIMKYIIIIYYILLILATFPQAHLKIKEVRIDEKSYPVIFNWFYRKAFDEFQFSKSKSKSNTYIDFTDIRFDNNYF